MSNIGIKIKFDNGGGITVEIPSHKYSHHFGDGKDAARMVRDLGDPEFRVSWLDCNMWADGVRADYDPQDAAYIDCYPGDALVALDGAQGAGRNVDDFIATLMAL